MPALLQLGRFMTLAGFFKTPFLICGSSLGLASLVGSAVGKGGSGFFLGSV